MLNVEIPAPSNIWRSSWISQPNFRGGYVYFSIDSNRHGVTPALMGGTINVDNTPRLLFAGEATDDFYGYANGEAPSTTIFLCATKILVFLSLNFQERCQADIVLLMRLRIITMATDSQAFRFNGLWHL